MRSIITLILLGFYTIISNSETIHCNGNCQCSNIYAPGETCTLNCEEDNCKSSTLTCSSGRPCTIHCLKDSSCADYTIIDARLSTDVNIMCNGNDACKSYLNIKCGRGDCNLACGPGTSCEEMDATLIEIRNSHSFICNNCPPSIANLQFTLRPTQNPTINPTYHTRYPSISPTKYPTFNPSISPTKKPTISPTKSPTKFPTISPTKYPTNNPSQYPTISPTKYPTNDPTYIPTANPTTNPTYIPTTNPTTNPTLYPSKYPSINPTISPSIDPTNNPTNDPTISPTIYPTINPSIDPTYYPSVSPTLPSVSPSYNPTIEPTTAQPTRIPTVNPTDNVIIMDTKDITYLYNGNVNMNNNNNSGVFISILLVSIVIILIVSIITVWWYRKKAFRIAMNRLERVDSTKTLEDYDESDAKQIYIDDMDGIQLTGMTAGGPESMNIISDNTNTEYENENITENDSECIDEGIERVTYAIRMNYNGRKFVYEIKGKDVIETGGMEWNDNTFEQIKNATKKKFGVNDSNVQLYEVVGDCPIDIDDMDDIVCSFYDTNRQSIDIFVKAENDIHYVDQLEIAEKTLQ